VSSALKQVKAKTLVVGISSDQLFPVGEQHLLAASITQARYVEIDSDFGHDGFLIETDELTAAIRAFQKDKLQETKPIVRTAFRNRAEVA
jgi:homoserine O-acetyltransferase